MHHAQEWWVLLIYSLLWVSLFALIPLSVISATRSVFSYYELTHYYDRIYNNHYGLPIEALVSPVVLALLACSAWVWAISAIYVAFVHRRLQDLAREVGQLLGKLRGLARNFTQLLSRDSHRSAMDSDMNGQTPSGDTFRSFEPGAQTYQNEGSGTDPAGIERERDESGRAD